MTLVLAGVVLIRGNDGGVAVNGVGAGESGGLVKTEVMPCAGMLTRGDGTCFPDVFSG